MTRITIAKGDGIGPEIMEATLSILEAAGAQLAYDEIEIGEKVYLAGNTAGISPEAWDIIRRNKVFLKAPITTPQGGGYKSLNVSTRKFLGLYANIRPCFSLHPYVATKHPKMDLVIIRENEEDLYAGIEHQQTDEVVQCLKLISRPGCEKIIRYAFEYAKLYGRKKVTCFTKDNIMKQTDGLFREVFNEIAAEYPDIANDHWIIDIGAAKLANAPQDIISDIAAEIAGSVGLAGSANIGAECAMFEAIHGSAPMIAGQGIANPSGLLLGAVQMLSHVGQTNVAEKIQNAWLKTIEDGVHTFDIYKEGVSTRRVNTQEFTAAVIANLGQLPQNFPAVSYQQDARITLPTYQRKAQKTKTLQGVDLFVHWSGTAVNDLASVLKSIPSDDFEMVLITNRGIKVYPDGFPETFCTDHWRCRFMAKEAGKASKNAIIALLIAAENANIDVVKTENLYAFDGKSAYSLGQGQ
jgi:isocitrate dehydrogenase